MNGNREQLWLYLAILGLAGLIMTADNWAFSTIMPAMAQELQVSLSQAGLLITAYMVPAGIFQPLFGILADRYGKRNILFLIMIVFSTFLIMISFAGDFISLVYFRAGAGLAAGSVLPVCLALIGDLAPLEQRQSAVGRFMGISFLGQGLSMALGGVIAFLFGWRYVFRLYALAAIANVVLLATLGRGMAKPVQISSQNRNLFKPYLQLLSSLPRLKVYLGVMFESALILGSFSFLGGYTKQLFGLNQLGIGFLLTAFGVMAFVAGQISGKAVGRFGQKNSITMGLFLAGTGYLTLVIFSGQIVIFTLGVAVAGFGFMLAHSIFVALTTEFAQHVRSVSMALLGGFFLVGAGMGTAAGGFMIDRIGITNFYLVFVALIFVLMTLSRYLVAEAVEGLVHEGL